MLSAIWALLRTDRIPTAQSPQARESATQISKDSISIAKEDLGYQRSMGN
jgi:hypothetical protein